MLLTVTNFSCF